MIKRLSVAKVRRGLFPLAALGFLAVGCVEEPAPFDPIAMQKWERSQDTEVKMPPMYPLPTTQQSRYVPGETEPRPRLPGHGENVPEGPSVVMSLQEIVHRAVVNNYDIKVAAYDTAVDQTRVMEAEGHFDPTLFSGYQFERVDKMIAPTEATVPTGNIDPNHISPTDFTTIVSTFDKEAISTAQAGIRQNTLSGAQLELKEQVVNSWFDPQRSVLPTSYDNELVLTITQPLLQNYGVEVNEARITISRNNQRVSLLDFRKTVEDTVLQIEKIYWELVQARQDIATLERLVKASEETSDKLFHRQTNDTTSVEIQQSNAATDSRRAELRAAQAKLGDLSDELKDLMNDPQYPVSSSSLIEPADPQIEDELHFDLDEQIEAGLENRLELGQQQMRIKSSETAIKVAKNNLLPTLNLQGSVTVDGLSADLGRAFEKQADFNHIGFVAGFQFEFPLGNRAARAIWQRALAQRDQAIASYGSLTEKVAKDVKEAARQVDTSWDVLRVDRNARFAYENTLASLQKQSDAGSIPINSETVQTRLDYQERLAGAEQAEHEAMYDYSFAIATLEKAKGTILRYNNVIMEEDQLPLGPSGQWSRSGLAPRSGNTSGK
jgi:outer membrane protein